MLKTTQKYKGYIIGVTSGNIWVTLNGKNIRDPFEDEEFKSIEQCKQWLDEDIKIRELEK